MIATAPDSGSDREFALTTKSFKQLTSIVRQRTGIVLSDRKREMVYGRLARRLRSLGLDSFSDYCALLEGSAGESEIGHLINAITTNHTKFYREPHHFSHLSEQVLRPAAKRWCRGERFGLRIWSAGCSSGEEPYSIAFCVAAMVPDFQRRDIKILATDLDSNMLATGKAGVYSANSIDPIPDGLRRKYLAKCRDRPDRLHISEPIRTLISFRQLNLFGSWPLRRRYGAIFCRNVMIYFDAESKRRLVSRFIERLEPGGILYLGHSESLLGSEPGLTPEGPTIYRKAA